VTLQRFEVQHPLNGEPVEMENVVASWFPERTKRVVIGAHFDTRPRPDKEPTKKKRAEPFLGANDGASGVAVLMELANMMRGLKTTVGVDLVAFDGEELVWDDDGRVSGEFFEGSSHFAEQYQKAQKSGSQSRYVAGIVVDMVGGNVLRILPDQRGKREAPQLVQEVWSVARRLKATGFRSDGDYDVSDDHWPLLDVGIPAIDIIDFSYKHWHLASDTPDKCSAASLAQVGGVLAEWLRGK
jgi:Zn-dependent M28 family amino/carboxypeptidase